MTICLTTEIGILDLLPEIRAQIWTLAVESEGERLDFSRFYYVTFPSDE